MWRESARCCSKTSPTTTLCLQFMQNLSVILLLSRVVPPAFRQQQGLEIFVPLHNPLIIMAKVKNFTLSKPQIKALLQDIEATGEARQRVEPTRILGLKPHLYGDIKSVQRTAFLKKYYQLRRNSLANYSKYKRPVRQYFSCFSLLRPLSENVCQDHGVQLNATNAKLYKQEQKNKIRSKLKEVCSSDESGQDKSHSDSDSDTTGRQGEKEESEEEEGEEGEDDISSEEEERDKSYLLSEKAADHRKPLPIPSIRRKTTRFATPSTAMSSSSPPSSSVKPSRMTPPRGSEALNFSPGFLPPELLLSPPLGVGTISRDDDESNSSAAQQAWNGSRENPFVTFVDLAQPERNRDFEAALVLNMERRDSYRTGVVVRKLILPPDEDKWSAEIPPSGEFPMYRDRCFLVRGPSLDFFQRNPDLYHQKTKCGATKMAHERVAGNKVDDWVYYLVVFPESIVLDNTHFAGYVTHKIDTNFNRIQLDEHHPLNEFGKGFRFVYVYWEISLKHGGTKKQPTAPKVDKKKLYD